MITLPQYAQQTNVTVRTVYRRLQKVKGTSKARLTVQKDGVTYITDAAIEKIAQQYDAPPLSELSELELNELNELNEVNATPDTAREATPRPKREDEMAYLREELRKEREHSRAQSIRMADLAAQVAELVRNNQLLLGAEQSRTHPVLLGATQNKPAKKTGLLAWIWGMVGLRG